MKIFEKNPCSDHLLIYAKFTLDFSSKIIYSGTVTDRDAMLPIINCQWAKATDLDLENYRQGTHSMLSRITVPSIVYCKDARCTHDQHRHLIDVYYASICNVLTDVSKLTVPTTRFKCSQDFIVPGFNKYLKELHYEARAHYLNWRNAGRPRTGESHSDMRVSRLRFKYAYLQCRANEDMMRADALAYSLKSKDSTSFWKDVRNMANSKIPLASEVRDAVGSGKITDMWQSHYSELLNSVHDTSLKSFVSKHIDTLSSDSIDSISSGDVSEGLKNTKLGKSTGIDGLIIIIFI